MNVGVDGVESVLGELVADDVVVAQLDVRGLDVEPPGVDVGDDYVTIGSDFLPEPSGDRPAAPADLQAHPARVDAHLSRLTDRDGVEARLENSKTAGRSARLRCPERRCSCRLSDAVVGLRSARAAGRSRTGAIGPRVSRCRAATRPPPGTLPAPRRGGRVRRPRSFSRPRADGGGRRRARSRRSPGRRRS